MPLSHSDDFFKHGIFRKETTKNKIVISKKKKIFFHGDAWLIAVQNFFETKLKTHTNTNINFFYVWLIAVQNFSRLKSETIMALRKVKPPPKDCKNLRTYKKSLYSKTIPFPCPQCNDYSVLAKDYGKHLSHLHDLNCRLCCAWCFGKASWPPKL